MPTIHVIYASTSGHTEFVVDVLTKHIKGVSVEKQRAELAQPEDLLRGDVLVLASSTWNTGSVEGQLNPHMYELLKGRAADVDLNGKRVALIGLGDERYHFTVGALAHLEEFVKTHNGELIVPYLQIVNEPYGQEDAVHQWADTVLTTNYQLPTTNS